MGSGGYLPTTSPLRLHVLQDGGVRRRRVIDYTNLHGGNHVRIFSRTFFIKQLFQNFFVPFPRVPAARCSRLRTPLLAPPTLGFFPPLHLIFNERFYSGNPNLQRHPYVNAVFGFPSSRHVPYDLFPPPYLHLN